VATSDLRDQLQAALGTQYTIEREIGRGGMATVYLAQDAKHHRSVALKVLHADLAASLGSERFRREIAIAAKLQHPHILTVLDSGETPTGLLWFTMPYIEGESLRDRLRRQHQLPLDDALRITREIALALDYAHRHGVIHRDIKPENILLVDGQAMIADFGIARALGAGGAPTGATLTETGMAIGTPAYMSPEQAAGERSLEGTTDVYSLGAVLYEMLTGEPPFTGATAQAIAAKMMAGDPPSVRRTRPTVPVSVDTAVRKALSPVPADRYATAAEFARTLDTAERTATAPVVGAPSRAIPFGANAWRRSPVWAVLIALVAGVAVYFVRHSRGQVTTGSGDTLAIAVLPFDNVGDSADAYFADGMTDAVRGKLASLSGLTVTAPVSSSQYRHTTKTPQQIGRELGVRYLLMGRVRWAKTASGASRVQVTPALVEAATAADKWDAPFDAPLTDVFQVQSDIATRVVQALKLTLTPAARQALATRPTANLDAYDAYVRGRAIMEQGGAANFNRQAIPFFAEAVRRDSTFALAWAALAQAHLAATGVTLSAEAADDADAGRLAAKRALELAPDLPEAHAAQALYYYIVPRDLKRALAEYQAGLAATPDNPSLLSGASVAELELGLYGSALAHREAAARLDPRNPDVLNQVCQVYLGLHRYADAQRACDRTLALAPTNMWFVEWRIFVSLAQADLAGARAIVRAIPPTLEPRDVVAYLAQTDELGWVLDSAQERLLLSQGNPSLFDPGSWFCALAQQYGYRGDTVRARVYAESARVAYATSLRAAISQSRPLPPGSISQLRIFYALSLGYLNRRDSAVAEARLAEAAMPTGTAGAYIKFLMAKVYILVGEPDPALDILEPLVKVPSLTTAGWLKIDPNFTRLRGNPRFERLIARHD
jgi:TolB-like protein